MSNLTIEQQNKIIGVFVGVQSISTAHLRFHCDWGALMPVVSKIETIENGRFGFNIDPWEIQIIDYKENENNIVCLSKEYEGGDRDKHLQQCYFEAIIIFINWYNRQNEQSNN